MQTSNSKQPKHAVGQLLAQKQKAPHRTARHRKKSLLFNVVPQQQHVLRLPSAPRAHPKKYKRKLLLKLVLQQLSRQVLALLVLQPHGQLLAVMPVQRQHNLLLAALLVLQRK